jgi:two-component system, OmpR family, torCAD operon response regulator TorR
MPKSHKILVVEDDPVSRETLAAYLRKAGYGVVEAENGDGMRQSLARDTIDLVMLDLSLPGEDGLVLLQELRRQSEIGVIIVSGHHDEVDRIVALEMGADDYVTKPFNARELQARAKNLIRRTQAAQPESRDHPVKRFSGWTLDAPHWTLTDPAGHEVRLTRGEFELLVAFASRPGRVLTRDNLLDYVSHRDWSPNDRTIDVLVGRLRRKLETDPLAPRLFITIHGVGYVFAGSEHA